MKSLKHCRDSSKTGQNCIPVKRDYVIILSLSFPNSVKCQKIYLSIAPRKYIFLKLTFIKLYSRETTSMCFIGLNLPVIYKEEKKNDSFASASYRLWKFYQNNFYI